MEIKELINTSGIDRREIAKAVDMSYHSLSARINEFVPWKPEEIEAVEKYIQEQTRFEN